MTYDLCWPGTDIVKSHHNDFNYSGRSWLNWAKTTTPAAVGTKITAHVERSRANGVDPGAIHGISKKADALVRLHKEDRSRPRIPKEGTQAAQLLDLLKSGPNSCLELSKLIGCTNREARNVLDREVGRGNLVKLPGKIVRFTLAEAA